MAHCLKLPDRGAELLAIRCVLDRELENLERGAQQLVGNRDPTEEEAAHAGDTRVWLVEKKREGIGIEIDGAHDATTADVDRAVLNVTYRRGERAVPRSIDQDMIGMRVTEEYAGFWQCGRLKVERERELFSSAAVSLRVRAREQRVQRGRVRCFAALSFEQRVCRAPGVDVIELVEKLPPAEPTQVVTAMAGANRLASGGDELILVWEPSHGSRKIRLAMVSSCIC